MPSIDEIFDQHIAEAERKAQTSYDHRKWMMFGYWKAIAVHLRKIKREVCKDVRI
ncbi:MAG: hypothetical protein KAR06_02775 [Deltaproteobacteria bacterium]|nr:hypothetical protein [Deltaproteobacteria bacterium]